MKIKEIITEDTTNYYNYAHQLAQKYNVPFSVVAHAMQKETGHLSDWAQRAKAVSKAGAGGIMQLMPKTATGLGVKDIFNPKQNIEGGVKYLGQLYNKYSGDPVKTLAAYNTGPGNLNKLVSKYGDERYTAKLPRETRGYVKDYDPALDRAQRPDTQAPSTNRNPYIDAATNVLAAITGSRDAYGSDQPPRPATPLIK
jgi:soluble lytic murein transglycosylase-like protein